MNTISFFQLASPAFGIFSASFCFSTHVGIAFKADKEYVSFDDLKAKALPNEFDNGWLQSIKPLIVGNKEIKPEDYQHMGRMNSATYIHQRFNLPSPVKEKIDALLFGSKTLTLCQRLDNGLLEIIKTHVLMLSLFVLIYWSNLFPLDSVSNLIAAGMIEDPESVEDAQVQFFLEYHRELLGSVILTPIGLYALVKTYNIH